MIFRKFKDGEEISFCNVDTAEDALEVMLDPFADDEIREAIEPTIHGFKAVVNGHLWEIKRDDKEEKMKQTKKLEFTVCDGAGIIVVEASVTELLKGEIKIETRIGDEEPNCRITSSANHKVVKVK